MGREAAGYGGNTPGRNSHRSLPLLQVLLEERRNPLAALSIHEAGTAVPVPGDLRALSPL
jgi:hypothetical protein